MKRLGLALSDFSPRKRHDMLWEALNRVLKEIERDESTSTIAELLRLWMDLPAGETPMVLTWLKKVAPLVPEASQTGAVVKAYGHYGRRWVWSRRAGLAPVVAVDASDW